MNWKPETPQARLRLLALLLLLAGLTAAGSVYLTAEDVTADPWVEQLQGSKAYRRNLELYGGKLNVIGDDLSHWFKRQWQGKRLAFTLVVLSGFTSLALVVIANHLQPDVSTTQGAAESRVQE